MPAILRLITFIVVGWLLMAGSVKAQKIEFERHSLEAGLSHPTVHCIMQDKQGFIWLGTQDGLNRWDGYSFKSYKHTNDVTSISHGCVWALHQDKKGRIWVGNELGLNLFEPATETFKVYHMVLSGQDSSKAGVRTIAETESGLLLIGTAGDGLLSFDPDTKTFQRFIGNTQSTNPINIFALCIGRNDNLWVGSDEGLVEVNLVSRKVNQYRHSQHDQKSLSNDFVTAVYIDMHGQLWIGTRNGLNRFDAGTKTFERFFNDADNLSSISGNYLTSISEDNSGRLWFGTQNGLNLFDPFKKGFQVYKNRPEISTSLSDNIVNCLLKEKSGHLIIGTYGNGISVLDGREKQFTNFSHDPDNLSSLSSNIVWSFFKDSRGRLWVGTNNGLNLLNDDQHSFQNHRQNTLQPHWFGNNPITAIAEDNDNQLWLGTERNGLFVLNLSNQKIEHYLTSSDKHSSLPHNSIAALHRDRAGNIWVGTFNGLCLFNSSTKTFTNFHHGLGDAIQVNSIYENDEGQLWLATSKGGSLFDPVSKTFKNYSHIPGDTTTLSSNFVMSVIEDQNKGVWFATDHGLNFLNTQIQKINTLHYGGLDYPGDYFYSIVEDTKGRLWSGMNKGLLVLSPDSNFAPDQQRWGDLKNYTQADGIQHNEFNIGAYFKDKNGWLYMGGINGFSMFHPDSIQYDAYVPPVYIRELAVFNKIVQPGKTVNGFSLPVAINNTETLVLSHHESIFTLEFAALAYTWANQFQYAYQLQNFENEWNYTKADRRFATYTNLDPGTYVFRIKAANRDGVWGEEKSLTIIITPPWWETWWFRILLLLSAMGGVVALLYYRTKRINQLNQTLKVAVMMKTNELEEKNEELVVQTTLLEQKNQELERAKGQLEFELQYQHQRQLLKLSIDVQEGERKRIAQDLHDELGAVLSIARMHLVHLESVQSEKTTLQGLQQARVLTENALVTMRRISHELMPLQLQKYGLIKTLEALTQQINDANKINVELITPEDEPRWSKPAELGLYRIIMEMINNTIKHTQASSIRIQINQSLDHIVVTYADNGNGLPENHSKGLGLQNIDARINALGGSFEIVKESLIGFTARIIIPLKS